MIFDHNLTILIYLISLGLFGGLSHCGFMCGPFVLMQINNNLKNIQIENVTYLQKLRGLALLPYHLGRITTYSFLGLISSLIGQNIRNNLNFKWVSAAFLLVAALVILNIFLQNLGKRWVHATRGMYPSFLYKLWPTTNTKKVISQFFSNFLKYQKISNLLQFLFHNPRGIKGYLLGIILGFIPCGLLYSALIIAANFNNYFLAFLGMTIFGIATIPALFITGVGGFYLSKNMRFGFKTFSQFILLINVVMLLIMSLSQLKII